MTVYIYTYIFIMVTTLQSFRTEVYNIKQEGPKGKPTKADQNKQKHMGKEAMETPSYRKAKDKRVLTGLHISIITLNVNELNSPIKRHRVAEWIKKQNPNICCLQETSQLRRQI